LHRAYYVTLEKTAIVAKSTVAKYALNLFPAQAGKTVQE
jgi:hypothetical protein